MFKYEFRSLKSRSLTTSDSCCLLRWIYNDIVTDDTAKVISFEDATGKKAEDDGEKKERVKMNKVTHTQRFTAACNYIPFIHASLKFLEVLTADFTCNQHWTWSARLVLSDKGTDFSTRYTHTDIQPPCYNNALPNRWIQARQLIFFTFYSFTKKVWHILTCYDYLNTLVIYLHVCSKVANVMGSSAGAGSGEFHTYRNLRRKEYFRVARMEKDASDKEKKVRWHALIALIQMLNIDVSVGSVSSCWGDFTALNHLRITTYKTWKLRYTANLYFWI